MHNTTIDKYIIKIKNNTNKDVVDNLEQDSYTTDIEKKNVQKNIIILKKKYGDVLEKLEDQNKMLEIFEEVKKKREYKSIEKKIGAEHIQSIANLDFSDLHVEEVIDKETIN
jgi:hypothetical protein